MKILVCSDLHLAKFREEDFNYLRDLFLKYDKIIINGDFWDYWSNTFEDFIHSEWNRLFPILLKKDCVYVYGNHDMEYRCTKDVDKFSVEATNLYEMNIDSEKFYITHGHRLAESAIGGFIGRYERFLAWLEGRWLGSVFFTLIRFIGEILNKRFQSFVVNSKVGKLKNFAMKETSRFLFKDGWLICGDSHHPELDLNARFANSGMIQGGYASYIEIVDGDVRLVQEEY